ncbi:MocR-like pyridoxine biosynthesis transcription factor PdxR [Cohnella nanjingensis]|uniref:PLP-dependent aminotransferase family protein n=1 Tax=Cohnella nanjingensis TaxID=1387779 RepID=A0A7X0VJJ2_9BACL|nr:PLP-dependent aminotransferase family protein [Cohnella nanjingensis]MBB6675638.1 PLP-dependent aminotransferase family protein [Cohnella nanjingensis]
MTFQVPYGTRLAACGSKHLALYQAIRDSIVGGALPRGERLPSTRRLADLYGLSRGSVSVAYEMLAAEGFVRSVVGQGTFVAGGAPGTDAQPAGGPADGSAADAGPALSAWGRRLMEAGAQAGRAAAAPTRTEKAPISFVPRGMGERWFPWMEWKSSVAAQWRRLGPDEADERLVTEGSRELRRAIAGRLGRERGIACSAEDIVITGGSMQAIALLSQLLLEEGDTAVSEDPCYPGIRRAVLASGAALLPEPVDRQGIVPRDWQARMLFVTPTRQFPTGAVLTFERRLALLQWASRQGAWIVEDDYDSDFRWGGRPIEPLKSLDREERVIYVGSFSRSMRQEIRIGYAVLPRLLREPFIRAKQLYDPYPEGIAEQRALAGWMASGGYDRHLRRMRRLFHKRQERLRAGLAEELSPLFEVYPADAGLMLYARWKAGPEAYDRLRGQCRAAGISWGDGAEYAAEGTSSERSVVFGFAHLAEPEIAEGLRRIRRAAEALGLHCKAQEMGIAERGSEDDASCSAGRV